MRKKSLPRKVYGEIKARPFQGFHFITSIQWLNGSTLSGSLPEYLFLPFHFLSPFSAALWLSTFVPQATDPRNCEQNSIRRKFSRVSRSPMYLATVMLSSPWRILKDPRRKMSRVWQDARLFHVEYLKICTNVELRISVSSFVVRWSSMDQRIFLITRWIKIFLIWDCRRKFNEFKEIEILLIYSNESCCLVLKESKSLKFYRNFIVQRRFLNLCKVQLTVEHVIVHCRKYTNRHRLKISSSLMNNLKDKETKTNTFKIV